MPAAPPVVIPPLDSVPTITVGAQPQAVFAFEFPFWEAADIIMYVGGSQLDPSLYTVQGFYEQDGLTVSGGYGSGQVTLTNPVLNADVIVDRQVVITRQSVFALGAPLPVPAMNSDLNRVVAMLQDVRRRLPMVALAGVDFTFLSDAQADGLIQRMFERPGFSGVLAA